MTIYKIRHKVTNMYSMGGFSPYWNSTGKFWKKIHHVNAHLGLLSPDTDTSNWEIVEYNLEEIKKMDIK